MNWYVVYTKPKWEKKVAERLNELGIVTYCPLIEKISQWSDRKKKVQVPLFNSYVFVQTEDNQRHRVFEISGVVRYLFWLGKPATVKNTEIQTIQNWLLTPNTYTVSLNKWEKGDKIVIESGLFVSQAATVKSVNQNHYVLVLESLGCLLRVEKKDF